MSGETELLARTGFADEYPFRSHLLHLDGLLYHYVDEGPGSTTVKDAAAAEHTSSGGSPSVSVGEPREPRGTLVCVHGNPTWSFAWRKIIQALSSEYRVLAVDHMGCGLSEKPQEYPYTLEQHISNLVRWIEALDLRDITLVAHDWGGAIGMGAAARLPDRFQRFVLMNTAAFRSQQIPFRIAICRWPILGPIAVRGFNGFARAALTMAVEQPARMTAAIKTGYLAPYHSWATRVAVMRFVQDIPLSPRHPSYRTLLEVEESLTRWQSSPMQLIWGMKDWCFTPDFLGEFVLRFPSARVLTLPDAGHYVFEDAPEQIIPALRQFLEQTEASVQK